jgi:CDP-diacylglycerol--inositol 3-phosphatidyltransferase
MANGNGAAVRSRQPPQEEEEEENIFLFIPNLIGMDLTSMAFLTS